MITFTACCWHIIGTRNQGIAAASSLRSSSMCSVSRPPRACLGLNVDGFLLMGYPGRLEFDETNTESAKPSVDQQRRIQTRNKASPIVET